MFAAFKKQSQILVQHLKNVEETKTTSQYVAQKNQELLKLTVQIAKLIQTQTRLCSKIEAK